MPKSYITHSTCRARTRRRWRPLSTLPCNVLAIGVSEMMARVRSIVDQVARALEFRVCLHAAGGIADALHRRDRHPGRAPLRPALIRRSVAPAARSAAR